MQLHSEQTCAFRILQICSVIVITLDRIREKFTAVTKIQQFRQGGKVTNKNGSKRNAIDDIDIQLIISLTTSYFLASSHLLYVYH